MNPENVLPFSRLRLTRKRHPSHDVPKAGTLDQISYCAACGMAFDDPDPCRATAEVPVSRTAVAR